MDPRDGETFPASSTPKSRVTFRLVAVICSVLYLLIDVLWLASEYPQTSRVGHSVAGALGWENRYVSTHPWIHLCIENTPNGPYVSTQVVPFSNADTRTPSATFTLWPPLPSSGYWAPTRRECVRGTFSYTTGIFNIQVVPPTELQEPIRDIIASTQPLLLEEYDELIATGGVGTKPILFGYLHNAASLAAAIAILVCSGSLLRDLWQYQRETRRPPGRCHRCGYDRSGLDAQSPCPECGEPRGHISNSSRSR